MSYGLNIFHVYQLKEPVEGSVLYSNFSSEGKSPVGLRYYGSLFKKPIIKRPVGLRGYRSLFEKKRGPISPYFLRRVGWEADDCWRRSRMRWDFLLSLSLFLPIVSFPHYLYLALATLHFLSLPLPFSFAFFFSPEEGWCFSVEILGIWYFNVCLWSVQYIHYSPDSLDS